MVDESSGTKPLRSPLVGRLIGITIMLVLTELLLRGLFIARVQFGTPPGCGVHPEILGRLLYAYGGGHYSMLSIKADITAPDPHRGYKSVPNIKGRDVSGAPLFTNSIGVRGTREYAVPKPATATRIVALGDSLTFGEGLKDNETWPAQLESTLPGAEVVNLGERGYAHDQMYFALTDDGLKLQPDVVILGFFDNDVWRDVLTYYCYEKPRFTKDGGGWRIENLPVPTPEELRTRYLMMPMLYAVPKGLLDALSEPSMSVQGGEDRATEIIDRMRKATEEAGARFVIVNVPEHVDAAPTTNGFFHQYCEKSGAECVDPWPRFRAIAGTEDPEKLKERFLRPHDIHYSKEGYAVVASSLAAHFAEHPIQPAKPH